jgi:hypothetical protein
MNLTSTSLSLFSPTLLIFFSSTTLSILTWHSGKISATSSTKAVPLFAISIRPILSSLASVNEPFLCPKSSDSKREGVIEGISIVMNGPSFLAD